MSNLIPTPRTDKHGRTVIRHMKPETSTTKPASPFPSVTLKPKDRPNFTSAKTVLMVALRKKFPESLVANDIRELAPKLASYSDATLLRVNNHPWTYISARTLTMGVRSSWTETTLNDYMAVTSALGITEGRSFSVMHTDSWPLYPELHPANNEGDYPEERLSQITALYRVCEHMDDEGLEPYSYGEKSHEEESYYIDDDDLRELILNPDEPYKREDIVEIITKQNIYDADHIKKMLDHSESALRNGVL